MNESRKVESKTFKTFLNYKVDNLITNTKVQITYESDVIIVYE